MSKKRCNKPDYVIEFEREVNRLRMIFLNIVSTIVVWKGSNPDGNLPLGMRSGYIQRKLYSRGSMLFFAGNFQKEQTNGLYCLPCARAGALNVYGEPTKFYAVSPIKTFERDVTNAVLIRANEARIAPQLLIDPLIEELADIRMAMRVNRGAAAKTPITVNVEDPAQELTVRNAFAQVALNAPIILKSQFSDLSRGYANNSLPPYLGRELREEYENVRAEILTLLGVISNPVQKAERVNLIEASSNRGELVDIIDSFLTYQKIAVKEINQMFGAELDAAGVGPLVVEMNNTYTSDMLEQGIADPLHDPTSDDGSLKGSMGADEEVEE